jgi:predicted transcriptional regulator
MATAISVIVREVMTKSLITVKTSDKVSDAIKRMTENDVGSVIVTENRKPVGILTERDILKRVCPEKLCMSRPLVHIEADAGLGQASSLMTLKDVRRLLVVDKGKIVGVVTQKDIMKGALETFMSLASI